MASRASELAHLAFERARAMIAEHHDRHAVDAARAQRAQFQEEPSVIRPL